MLRAATPTPRRSRLAAALHSSLRRLGGRNRAVDHLRRADERLNTIVTGARGIIYISDLGPDGRWTYVSPQVEEILGFTPAEWISDPGLWARRLHPDRKHLLARVGERRARLEREPRIRHAPDKPRLCRARGGAHGERAGADREN